MSTDRQSNVVSLKAAFSAQAGVADAARGAGNLYDSAYQQIRQALMDGRLAPGQTFTLRALAEVFGMSLIPVRDALRRLVAERALELHRNRSVVLPAMSRRRFREILQIRLALEPMLAERGALAMPVAAIDAMAADQAQMNDAARDGDVRAFLAANRRFHFRLYEAADTAVMLPIVEGLWMQIGPHLHSVFGDRSESVAAADVHHLSLLKALRRQDAAGAARAVWNDLADAADYILKTGSFEDPSP